MADLSQLSNEDLQRLYQISQQESKAAPDSSTIQSDKGAVGSMQVMPDTAKDPGFGVKPSNGTPEDTARMGRDYYLKLQEKYQDSLHAAVAYNWGPGNTDKWLASGGDLSKLPDEALKYAYNFNKNAPQQKPNVDSPDYSKMSDADLKAAYAAQQNAPSAAQQRGRAAIQSMAPDTNAIGNAVTGLGETAAQMGSGMFGQAAGALHGAADLLTGGTYEQAKADLNAEREPVTYNPRTQAGQDISKNVGEMFDKYLTKPLEQGGSAVGQAFGFSPEESQQMAEVGTSLFENLGLPGLLHAGAPKGGAGEVKAPGAVSELDRLNAAQTPEAPPEFVGPPREPMGPNSGPQRAPFAVDSAGNVDTGMGLTPEQQYMSKTLAKQRALDQENPNSGPQLPKTVKYGEHPDNYPMMVNGDTNYFQTKSGELISVSKEPSNDGGVSAPGYTPSENDSASFVARNRQGDEIGRVNFSPNDPAIESEVAPEYRRQGIGSVLYNLAENHGAQIVGHEDMGTISPDAMNLRRSLATRGDMTSHVDAYREAIKNRTPQQLDMFGIETPEIEGPIGTKAEGNQVVPELPRSLSSDEFGQIVSDLAEKDGTRFPMPEDMDVAYSKYLDMVRDDQGGLFDRPSIAENFAKAAVDEALSRRVNEHPTVRANQAALDHLLAQDQSVPTVARQVKAAQDLLQKSQDNIRKFYEPTAKVTAPFYAKDGTVHMYTFGYLPEMMKSLGALLKGIHGVVFKTLDKMIPSFKNMDSPGKIAGQGIKDFVNKQANREWAQTVNAQPRQLLNGVAGLREGLKDYLPHAEDISPSELKAQMQEAPDLSQGMVRSALRNNLLTGQQLQAFSHHPLVKYAVNTVDSAMRNAAQFVRQELVGKDGLRAKVRALSEDELTGIWSLMEMNEGAKEFNNAELKHAGYSDKQISFYRQRMELNDRKLQTLNEGRAQAGLAPVDRRIAHIAGHFLGDFKTLIKDADGNVKAVIAHNNRAAVKTIANRVMGDLGEGHTMTPIEMRKLSEGGSNDRYTGYMNILNDMAGRDPVVDSVVQAYKEYMSNDAQAAMKYRAAFKSKEGVIGAEGRKSWQSAQANAKEGVKNELKALEAMNTWSEMQKALAKVKDFQADPDINAPVAKGAVQSYLDNVQHRNQGLGAAFANSLVNGVSEITGVGPTALRQLSAGTKTGLLTMFIGLGKLSHSFVTLIQPLQGIPVVNSLMKAEGAKLGLTQVTAALKSFGSQAHILEALAKGGDATDPFVRKALAFAKDNDTFNSAQFQFGNLTDINRSNLVRTAHNIAEFNVTGMESATRSFTYMYYAHMLRDLGMSEKEIFPAAHNAMKDVMVDYNSWERPGVFGKLGLVGDLTAMLTRYKFNQIDQFARAGKYATQGKLGPMATVLATSMMAAGVRGIMAYTLANQAVQGLTTWAAENKLMEKPTSIDEILLHALHGKNENLTNAVKFGLPSALGINMTGSLSHADDIPNDPLGSLIPQSEPIVDMAKSAYNFARDPNKATAKTMAYDLAPNSAKGILENKMFTDEQGRFTNPHNYELQTTRTPADQAKRTFGFRPLNEANESLTTNVANKQKQAEASVRQDIIQRVLRDIDSNKGVTPQLQRELQKDYIPKFLANNGNPQEIVNEIVQHQGMGQARTAAQRAQGIPKSSLSSLFNYERTENLK